ncbi:MAG: YceI family protein [Neomegalonema sp.]|nr:YceI family protein [Neomegalonema sp.]
MKKTIAGLLGLAALAFAAPVAAQEIAAPSGSYVLDPTHTSVTWRVKHIGLAPYTARFEKVDMKLELNVEDPSKSKITAAIDAASVSTGYPGKKDFDGEIESAGFLNAKGFPKIEFVSTKVEPMEGGKAKVTGNLTLLGVTKEVVLTAELTGSIAKHPFAGKPAVGFLVYGKFDRSKFGSKVLDVKVGNGAQVVGNIVEVMIAAEFVKAD